MPLRAQLAMINSTKANPVLAENRDYIEKIESIHGQCLAAATPEAQKAYEKAKTNLNL